MDPQKIVDLYVQLAPVVLGVGAFLVVVLPILGRLVALKWPRLGEQLIRTGTDLKGVVEAAKLPPGTPSVSAAPMPSAAPVETRSTPHIPPLPIICIFLVGSGCAGGAGQMQRFVDTTVEAIPLVDDQLHRSYNRELAACADVPCVDRVEAEWRPVFSVMQGIRDVWCTVAPEAEGC